MGAAITFLSEYSYTKVIAASRGNDISVRRRDSIRNGNHFSIWTVQYTLQYTITVYNLYYHNFNAFCQEYFRDLGRRLPSVGNHSWFMFFTVSNVFHHYPLFPFLSDLFRWYLFFWMIFPRDAVLMPELLLIQFLRNIVWHFSSLTLMKPFNCFLYFFLKITPRPPISWRHFLWSAALWIL